MKKVYIVTGPPCSGKSTYVREHMGPTDAAADLDELENALCFGTDHRGKTYLAPLARHLKREFVNYINAGANDKLGAFWIINTAPADALARSLFGVCVEVVNMKADEAECLRRLANDTTRPDKDFWRKAIAEYFEAKGRTFTDRNRTAARRPMKCTKKGKGRKP